MYYIKEENFIEYEIKKSKFIAYLFTYENFHDGMERLKKEHPKARHFVYAYRYLNEFDQIVENSSDDGEPKGTSGKPSLAVLAGKVIVNAGVIIIRYFGGTKLGTGGLVRAYTNAVNLAIDSVSLIPYVKIDKKVILFEYSNVSIVEYHINRLNIEVVKKDFEKNVFFQIAGEKSVLDQLIAFLKSENILLDVSANEKAF